MTIAQIMEKMIIFSDGNIHDIDHFIRVWTFAKTIGEMEKIDDSTQLILEVAAITHDIACPLCREKYGHTHARFQESEGAVMVKDFLAETGLSEEQINRVSYLVGHHHTFTDIDGMDYQILVEADYIVNGMEKKLAKENIESFIKNVMKTESGIRIIKSIFSLDIEAYYKY